MGADMEVLCRQASWHSLGSNSPSASMEVVNINGTWCTKTSNIIGKYVHQQVILYYERISHRSWRDSVSGHRLRSCSTPTTATSSTASPSSSPNYQFCYSSCASSAPSKEITTTGWLKFSSSSTRSSMLYTSLYQSFRVCQEVRSGTRSRMGNV